MADMSGLPGLRYGPSLIRPAPIVDQSTGSDALFSQLARTAHDIGQAFDAEGEARAKKEGAAAVTRDADGKIVVAPHDSTWFERLVSPSAQNAYENAASLRYLSERSLDLKSDLNKLHNQYALDPDGFDGAVHGLRESYLRDLPNSDWAPSLDGLISEQSSQHRANIYNKKADADEAAAAGTVTALINDNLNDLVPLARKNLVDTPQWQTLRTKTRDLINSKVGNPSFRGYSQAQADLDWREIDGRLIAELALGRVEGIYRGEGLDAAKEEVERLYNDEKLELTPAERDRIRREGFGILSDLEGERREGMQEAQLRLGSAVEDAKSAAEFLGEWRSIVTPDELAAAYGPERAAKMTREFDFAATTHKRALEIALASPDEISGLLERERPKSAGQGFALQQERYEALSRAASRRQQLLEGDPVGFIVGSSPYVRDLGAKADKGDVSARSRYASALLAEQERLGVPTGSRALLSKGEADAVAQQLTSGSPDQAVRVLQAVTSGLTGEQLQVVSRQIAGKSRAAAVAVSLANEDPVLASDIIIGERFLAENGDTKPTETQIGRAIDKIAGGSGPGFFTSGTGGLFAFAPEARATAIAAGTALYGRQMIGGKPGSFDEGKFDSALRQVLGNPFAFRGQIIVAPRPEMDAGDMADLMRKVDDNALRQFGNGVPMLANGKPVSAADIARHGVLTYTGSPGIYRVQFPGQGHLGVSEKRQASAFPEGMVEPGTQSPFDFALYPQVKNADGSVSNVITKSFGFDGQQVLIPTMVGGKKLSDAEAIANYRQTGDHFGKFDSVSAAKAFADELESSMQNKPSSLKPAAGRTFILDLGAFVRGAQ